MAQESSRPFRQDRPRPFKMGGGADSLPSDHRTSWSCSGCSGRSHRYDVAQCDRCGESNPGSPGPSEAVTISMKSLADKLLGSSSVVLPEGFDGPLNPDVNRGVDDTPNHTYDEEDDYDDDESPEEAFSLQLQELFAEAGWSYRDFKEVGMMTQNAGLVVDTGKGSFQLVIHSGR